MRCQKRAATWSCSNKKRALQDCPYEEAVRRHGRERFSCKKVLTGGKWICTPGFPTPARTAKPYSTALIQQCTCPVFANIFFKSGFLLADVCTARAPTAVPWCCPWPGAGLGRAGPGHMSGSSTPDFKEEEDEEGARLLVQPEPRSSREGKALTPCGTISRRLPFPRENKEAPWVSTCKMRFGQPRSFRHTRPHSICTPALLADLSR